MKQKTQYFFSFIFCIMFCATGFSQRDKLKEADKMFESYAFIDAQEVYLEVAEAGYESENLFKKLGDSYYFNSEMEEAKKWYEKLFEINPNQEKAYFFRYAQALKAVESYDKADEIMLEFDKLNGESDSRVKNLRNERNYLELIEMQSGKFKIDTLEINSELSDFAPILYGDTLIFASNREISSSMKRVHEWNKQPYLNLYRVEVDSSLVPTGDTKEFSEKLTSKFHESSAVFTDDGNTVYFTRNSMKDGKLEKSEDGTNYLRLYKSERKDNEWQNPEPLSFTSVNSNYAHPSLNEDETKLYFSSDMQGTNGMSDIYVVDISEDGTFGKPRNLGSKINTEGRESFPFVSNDNLLFFSSDGHNGLGGLDVYVTVIKDDNTYGEIFNLGRPINSSKDDFSFIIDSEKKLGFFATNREGTVGEDDIYRLEQTDELITSCQQKYEGRVVEVNKSEGIPDATVELFDENLNLLKTTTTNENGEYEFEVECETRYIVRVSKDGFKTYEDLINSGSDYEAEIEKDMVMTKGNDLGVTRAKQGDDLSDILQLDPIYFKFDKSQITPQAEVELQKVISLLKTYKNMKIDVRSHTDSRAGDAYNKILSEKRAQSTVNYIVENGNISRNRISGKGYGETQLVNECSNGVDCTESQHALNRRSEFIILNENETPKEMRDKIAKNEDFEPKAKADNTPSESSFEPYDFNSSEKVFTVQVSAVRSMKNASVDNIPDTFYHKYDDGYIRFYSKTFKTKSQANAHKNKLRKQGAPDAFVIALKGKQRIY
ncbi:OmpA family protein [Psychroflexus aestuariivivens]|uniref:OmpA family protein n=1 Tax=Psychroflexus aestuariivivens TaxID=1795040 RepID=UPI000FD90D53|nr:OmpA family protein [Psychroflexus aestuariivivens]